MAKTSSTRDQRSVIMKHAAKLFLQKGYHAATMDDLAAVVQLNKATVYYYFKSKANLLFDILLSSAEDALATIQDLPPDLPSDERLRRFIINTVVFLTDNSIDAGVFFQEESFLEQWLERGQVRMIRSRQRDFEAFAESLVRTGQKEGLFNPNLDCRVTSEAFLGMMHWHLRQHRRPGKRIPAREIAEQWAEMVLSGLVCRT